VVGRRELPGRQAREEPPEPRCDRAGLDVTRHGEHRVARDDEAAMESGQIGRPEGLQTGLVAVRIDGKRMGTKEKSAQPFLSERDHVIGVFQQTRELGVPLCGERGPLEGWDQHAVGQQFERAGEIRRQHFNGEAETVVARKRIE
jgi:hypothetical protein